MCMQDYAKLYRREHRIRVVQEEKLRRIRKVLFAGLPKSIALLTVFLITRKV